MRMDYCGTKVVVMPFQLNQHMHYRLIVGRGAMIVSSEIYGEL